MEALTKKEERFRNYYVNSSMDANGLRRAAAQAGYKPGEEIALMRKPSVRAAVERAKELVTEEQARQSDPFTCRPSTGRFC